MNQIILTLFCISLQLVIYSQPITGIITNAKTQKNIPYALITWQNGTKGTYTDLNGKFTIDNLKPKTSLFISALGYSDTTCQVALDSVIIALQPQAFEIETVEIQAKSYSDQWEKMPKKGLMTMRSCTGKYSYIQGTSFPSKGKGFFKAVKFFIRSKGSPENKLRLRIFKMGQNGEPSHSILNENVFIPHKKGWITMDIEQFKIPIPQTGYMIAIEWINSSNTTLENCQSAAVKGTKLKERSPYKGWTKSFGGDDWRSMEESPLEVLKRYKLRFQVLLELERETVQ